MIKLRLMQKDDVEDASKIIIKAHDYYYELDRNGCETVRKHDFLPWMYSAIDKGPVYLVGSKDEKLVAVYQLPFFGLERVGDKYGVYTKGDGHFATEPTHKGIGQEVLERLPSILSNVARKCDADALYHDEITRWKNELYERNGYKLIDVKDFGDRYAFHYYRKVYPADNLSLIEDEDKIVDEIVRRMLDKDVILISKDI